MRAYLDTWTLGERIGPRRCRVWLRKWPVSVGVAVEGGGEVCGEVLAEGYGADDDDVGPEAEQDGHRVEVVHELQFQEAVSLALGWR